MRTIETNRENRRTPSPFRALLLAALAIAALSSGWTSSASANPYTVQVCTATANATDGLFYPPPLNGLDPSPMFRSVCGASIDATIFAGSVGGRNALNGAGLAWGLLAPNGTQIKVLELDSSFEHTFFSFLNWQLNDGDGKILEFFRDDRQVPPPAHRVFQVNSDLVTGVVFCPNGSGPNHTCPEGPTPGSFGILLKNLVATLDDEIPPTVAAPDLETDTVRGTTEIFVSSSDVGSGIKEVSIFIDGAKSASRQSGGTCVPPYGFVVPCPLGLASSFPVDTTGLAEGPHQIAAAVVDASGRERVSSATGFIVHNAPTNTGRPRITGAAEPGSRLAADPGAWEGGPAFSFQWLRCSAAASPGGEAGCAEIAGATAAQYAVAPADLGQRVAVRVTAKNARGVAAALSDPTELISSRVLPPPPPDRTAPVLKKVSLTSKRLLFNKPKKAGTSLRFSTNEGGKLTIVLQQAPKKGKKPKSIGSSLAATVKAGRSVVPLGAVVASKHLRSGRYRFTITVRDAAGNLSKPASVGFKVVR